MDTFLEVMQWCAKYAKEQKCAMSNVRGWTSILMTSNLFAMQWYEKVDWNNGIQPTAAITYTPCRLRTPTMEERTNTSVTSCKKQIAKCKISNCKLFGKCSEIHKLHTMLLKPGTPPTCVSLQNDADSWQIYILTTCGLSSLNAACLLTGHTISQRCSLGMTHKARAPFLASPSPALPQNL